MQNVEDFARFDPKKIQEYPGNKRDISGIEYPERRGNDENLSPHTFSVTSPHKKKNLGIQRLSSWLNFIHKYVYTHIYIYRYIHVRAQSCFRFPGVCPPGFLQILTTESPKASQG